MDFYVYVHKKKSNGEVFYVGKGSGKRAWSSFGRNEIWQRTANKYGLKFEGTRQEFKDIYGFDLNHLLRKTGAAKQQKGWYLLQENSQ